MAKDCLQQQKQHKIHLNLFSMAAVQQWKYNKYQSQMEEKKHFPVRFIRKQTATETDTSGVHSSKSQNQISTLNSILPDRLEEQKSQQQATSRSNIKNLNLNPDSALKYSMCRNQVDSSELKRRQIAAKSQTKQEENYWKAQAFKYQKKLFELEKKNSQLKQQNQQLLLKIKQKPVQNINQHNTTVTPIQHPTICIIPQKPSQTESLLNKKIAAMETELNMKIKLIAQLQSKISNLQRELSRHQTNDNLIQKLQTQLQQKSTELQKSRKGSVDSKSELIQTTKKNDLLSRRQQRDRLNRSTNSKNSTRLYL